MNKNTERALGISHHATNRETLSDARLDSSNRCDALAAVRDECDIEPNTARCRQSNGEMAEMATELLCHVRDDNEARQPFCEPLVGVVLMEEFRERRARVLRERQKGIGPLARRWLD